MKNRETFEVTLTGVFEATSMESAVEQFQEWMVTGRRTVLVENLERSGDKGWAEVQI